MVEQIYILKNGPECNLELTSYRTNCEEIKSNPDFEAKFAAIEDLTRSHWCWLSLTLKVLTCSWWGCLRFTVNKHVIILKMIKPQSERTDVLIIKTIKWHTNRPDEFLQKITKPKRTDVFMRTIIKTHTEMIKIYPEITWFSYRRWLSSPWKKLLVLAEGV